VPASNRELALKPVYEKAVEIYATKPDIRHDEAAAMLGVSETTLLRLRRDPNFWAKVYDHYMVTFEGDVVGVLKAMVREAKAGNVQAGRLVLEHSGKLQKNINITVMSPFEKWMNKGEIDDAEVVNEFKEIPAELNDFSDLPDRKEEKGTWRARNEHGKVRVEITKEERRIRRNEARKIMRSWQKRAEAAGVDPLPARRPTKGQRKAWESKIIAKENQVSQSPQAQAGNSNTPCKPKNQKQVNPKPPTPPKT
tara:strand:+ start:258 stop:1013 length:756 start_codon:yes stop_codon:yes gene_type:complete